MSDSEMVVPTWRSEIVDERFEVLTICSAEKAVLFVVQLAEAGGNDPILRELALFLMIITLIDRTTLDYWEEVAVQSPNSPTLLSTSSDESSTEKRHKLVQSGDLFGVQEKRTRKIAMIFPAYPILKAPFRNAKMLLKKGDDGCRYAG
ncbi:MAG: hypothetical protein ALECFALPRED_001434 [Alectoria fallacina]|uniref:Uncharacterized protein n=1 Tax=Alectoria fallacina TaxID=1903189 RepID=A0A8H3FAP3_9LECA|nr:MAG: hypothetical protein ALECFALPRED_001434 [Alectoria fallacina]